VESDAIAGTVQGALPVEWKTVLDNLPEAVIVTDLSGTVSYANRQAGLLTGFDAHLGLVGMRLEDPRVLGDPAEDTDWSFDAALFGGHPLRDFQLRRLFRGEVRWLTVDAIPLSTAMGGRAGFIFVLRDGTEQHALETEQRWVHRELVAARERVDELLRLSEALNVIAEAIHGSIDPAEALERVLEEAMTVTDADVALVELHERDRWNPIVKASRDPAAAKRLIDRHQKARDDEGYATWPVQATVAGGSAPFTMVRAPLRIHGRLRGALTLLYDGRTDIPESTLGFLGKVAATVTLALENARLYEQEHHIAVTLQDALVVAPSHVEGVRFSHRYASATQAAWVGGDFFDVFPMPRDEVGLVIGDVSGKGIEASTLASFARQLIRAFAQGEPYPSRVLARVNDLVYRISAHEEFVTIFFGVLRLRDGLLRYTNGGHPAPIVVSEGSVWQLPGVSPMVGAFYEVDFTVEEQRLDTDATIVMYTDGLTEAKRDDVLYSQERLVEFLANRRPIDIGMLPSAILADVAEYASGALRDDIAIFCCQRV
jgi:PAS domain S-box-containing protein